MTSAPEYALRDRLSAALRAAASEDDATRLCTLRLVCAALADRETASRRSEEGAGGIGDAEVIEVLGQMARQRDDQIRAYEEAGRLELAEEERREADVIREFLPRPLSDEETRRAVADAIARTKAASLRDLGAVMGDLKARYSGRMDFCKAGDAVRATLR